MRQHGADGVQGFDPAAAAGGALQQQISASFVHSSLALKQVLCRVTADGRDTNARTWLIALQMISLPRKKGYGPLSNATKASLKQQCVAPPSALSSILFASPWHICEHIIRVEMPRRLIRPDDAHYGFVMRHCQAHELMFYFDEAMKIGAAGSAVWTSMIGGQCSAKKREMWFNKMLDAGVEPVANTWSTLVARYHSGAEKESVIMRMAASGIQPNAFAWSAAIAA
jgi:hypothetical protein